MSVRPVGSSPIQQTLNTAQTEATDASAEVPSHTRSIEQQPGQQPILSPEQRGRRTGESRIEGEVRRAALEVGLPRFSNYDNSTFSARPSQSRPLAPRPPSLPHAEYDYRNVSGGGIFSRGPNEALEQQHASNMTSARRYADQYQNYANQYLDRVRRAGSFQELQQLGSIQPPSSLGVGERGQALTVRQREEMQNLRGEIQGINQRTSSSMQRAQYEVAERFRQLNGTQAHGPNARIRLTLDTPVGYRTMERSVDRDGIHSVDNIGREGEVRLGRNVRLRGEVNSDGEVTGGVTVRGPGFRGTYERTVNRNREIETNVEAGFGTRNAGVTVGGSSNGEARIAVEQRGITTESRANPREGSFEQSVSVSIPGTEHSIELGVGYRGISEEEAARFAQALRGARSFFDLPPNVVRAMDQRVGR